MVVYKLHEYNRPPGLQASEQHMRTPTIHRLIHRGDAAGEHEDHYDPDFCIYNDVFDSEEQ